MEIIINIQASISWDALIIILHWLHTSTSRQKQNNGSRRTIYLFEFGNLEPLEQSIAKATPVAGCLIHPFVVIRPFGSSFSMYRSDELFFSFLLK